MSCSQVSVCELRVAKSSFGQDVSQGYLKALHSVTPPASARLKHTPRDALMPGPSPTPAQSASVQRATSALRDLQQRQGARSAGLPQQPTFSVTQRSGSALPGPILASSLQQDGLLPRTRAQLPRWYVTLRQLLLDAYRAVAVVYRIANHVLGSLFEVRTAAKWRFAAQTIMLMQQAALCCRKSTQSACFRCAATPSNTGQGCVPDAAGCRALLRSWSRNDQFFPPCRSSGPGGSGWSLTRC